MSLGMTPLQSMGETTVNKVVSIKTKRGNKKDMSYAPARWIEIPAVISGDGISFCCRLMSILLKWR